MERGFHGLTRMVFGVRVRSGNRPDCRLQNETVNSYADIAKIFLEEESIFVAIMSTNHHSYPVCGV